MTLGSGFSVKLLIGIQLETIPTPLQLLHALSIFVPSLSVATVLTSPIEGFVPLSLTINEPGISIICEIRPVPPFPPPNDDPIEDLTALLTLYSIKLVSINSEGFVGSIVRTLK